LYGFRRFWRVRQVVGEPHSRSLVGAARCILKTLQIEPEKLFRIWIGRQVGTKRFDLRFGCRRESFAQSEVIASFRIDSFVVTVRNLTL
jgi:hypothetical protein